MNGMPLLYQASENIVGTAQGLASDQIMTLFYEAVTWGNAAVETFVRTGYSNTSSDEVLGIDANTALGVDNTVMLGIRDTLVDAGWIPLANVFSSNGMVSNLKFPRGIQIRVIVTNASDTTDSITVSIG